MMYMKEVPFNELNIKIYLKDSIIIAKILKKHHKKKKRSFFFRFLVKIKKFYFNFFLGLSWFECPHFFLRQFLARGGNLA